MSHHEDTGWRENAACAGKPTSMFFPDYWDNDHCASARVICGRCPVKEPCLSEALRVRVNDDGIFAGTTPFQRKRMRTRAPDDRVCVECGAPYRLMNPGAPRVTCSPLCAYDHKRAMKRAESDRRRKLPDHRRVSHGSVSAYKNGCRCAACGKAANAARKRQRLKTEAA